MRSSYEHAKMYGAAATRETLVNCRFISGHREKSSPPLALPFFLNSTPVEYRIKQAVAVIPCVMTF